jgi:hypothetical protein
MVQRLEKLQNAEYTTPARKKPSYRELRELVLNYLLRYEKIIDKEGQLVDLNPILLGRLVAETIATRSQIIAIYTNFLYGLRGVRWALESKHIRWGHTTSGQYRTVRIYLHKLYHIAPVFSYSRALHNLGVLHTLLDRVSYYPTLSTQLALVIFVTDRSNVNLKDGPPIPQYNLRALCYSSAYAFHHARNRLQINNKGKCGL